MRISVWKDDPSYSPDAKYYRPYLDGVLLKYCFTADEELGEAWVYQTDENGKLMLDETKKKLLTKVLKGEVELRRLEMK